MPMDAAALRGRSALAGLGLLLTAFVMAYLNSTTTAVFWSNIYVAAIVISTLGSASKFSTALGVTHGLAKVADYVSTVVPWIALYFVGIQALHYHSDGLNGFMAGVSIITLVYLIAFGVTDSIGTWIGNTLHTISDAADEASNRMSAASEALKGQKGHR